MRRQGLGLGLVLLVAACTSNGKDENDASNPTNALVKKAGDNGLATAAIPGIKAGEPWSLYAGDVCSTGGAVRLSSVKLDDAKDLTLRAWGTRQFDDTASTQAPGAQAGTLKSFRIDRDPVHARCADGHADSVFVEVVRTGSAPVGTASVVFSYHKADGSTVMRPLKFDVRLCAGMKGCSG